MEESKETYREIFMVYLGRAISNPPRSKPSIGYAYQIFEKQSEAIAYDGLPHPATIQAAPHWKKRLFYGQPGTVAKIKTKCKEGERVSSVWVESAEVIGTIDRHDLRTRFQAVDSAAYREHQALKEIRKDCQEYLPDNLIKQLRDAYKDVERFKGSAAASMFLSRIIIRVTK